MPSSWEYFIENSETLDALLKTLERFLSSTDYVEERNGETCVVEVRGKVGDIDGYKIEIYSNEHHLPHFHVVKGSVKMAAYTIIECKRINGNLSAKLEKKILFFHKLAKNKLVKYWNNTRPGNHISGEGKV